MASSTESVTFSVSIFRTSNSSRPLQALTVLLRIVASYWLFSQLIAVLLIAPYLTYSEKYRHTFEDPPLNPTWFTFFQMWSAWSNNGMRSVFVYDRAMRSSTGFNVISASLNDNSMVPYRDSYFMIVVMGFLILGGNTAFPVL